MARVRATPVLHRLGWAFCLATGPGAALATDPAPRPQPAASAPVSKDIVLDQAPPAASTADGPRLVPRPTPPASNPTLASHQAALAGHVAELGLNLLRTNTAKPGNAVVSPASVSVALAMVSAGVAAPDAHEIVQLFGGGRLGAALLNQHLGNVLLKASAVPKDGTPAPLKLASRLWVHQASAGDLQQGYLKTLDERFQASAAAIDFGAAEPARGTINQWVAGQTAGLVPEVLPRGSLGASTRMVLTQATHFRSPWAQAFDPAATQALPFRLADGSQKAVPMLRGELKVRSGTAGSWELLELPFKQGDIVAQIAMPAKGVALHAALAELDGLDISGWGGGLQAHSCQVQLPKLALKPAPQSLKPALQALGVQRVFGPPASFAPALGKKGEAMQLDALFHAATVTLDEQGGEAAAATAAVVGVKSLNLGAQPRQCAVDRPFVLVLVHKPTQLPLFVARVQDPSQP
jgi:serpin B